MSARSYTVQEIRNKNAAAEEHKSYAWHAKPAPALRRVFRASDLYVFASD